jgi:hypothetical protein
MSTPIDVTRVNLPLPATINGKGVVTTCTAQSSLIKQCPAYASTPAVQAAVTDMDSAVSALNTTEGKIDNLDAEIRTLKTTRVQQIGTVRLKHDNVATTLNTASNGDPVAAQAWTGKTKARAKPAPVTQDVTPPAGASLRSLKKGHGVVLARCNPEPSAEGYLYQTGGDPNHPETWAGPSFSKSHTFKLRNLTIGQTVNMRIAVVRRGSVQSQYTQVLQVVVT